MFPHFVLMKIARDERTYVFRARTIYHARPQIARGRGHFSPKPAKNRQKRASAGCLCAVLRSGVRLRQPEQCAEKKKQRRRGAAAAVKARQHHTGRGQHDADDQNCKKKAGWMKRFFSIRKGRSARAVRQTSFLFRMINWSHRPSAAGCCRE